ncbi:unnamed protein product [Soboliphyme baturini]|uniref:E3 ubiquitin-protein ligase n=1 Tax=Soboliphyme baturini TaxID=241478 RepID=A0A183IVN0_9BILA|nr:unnamed protein product [Soboliphyme baturini]
MENDPDTLIEWLQNGTEEGRDIQQIALEQLCMMLLMSDNVDRCFDRCPPRKFLPALCHIFMDEAAPDSVLEVTARALTYYLDISSDCSRRIVVVDGSVKAICNRMATSDIKSRTSKDLGKTNDISDNNENNAALSVVTRLCAKADPGDASLSNVFKTLSYLLKHEDALVSDSILRCFSSLSEKYVMKGLDPSPIAQYGLIEHLLSLLARYGQNNNTPVASTTTPANVMNVTSAKLNAFMPNYDSVSSSSSSNPTLKNFSVFGITVSIISTLCRSSERMMKTLVNSEMLFPALENMVNQKEEFCLNDSLWLIHLILKSLFKRQEESASSSDKVDDHASMTVPKPEAATVQISDTSVIRNQLFDHIRKGDTAAFIETMESSNVDPNLNDDVGQSLLNWASAFGTPDMVEYLCRHGAIQNRSGSCSSLRLAARYGRSQTVKVLLKYGMCNSARLEHTGPNFAFSRLGNEVGSLGDNDTTAMVPKQTYGNFPSVYLSKVLPVLVRLYLQCASATVRRNTVELLKKAMRCCTSDVLKPLCAETDFGTNIVEVLSIIIDPDNESDATIMNGLLMATQLLSKNTDFFAERFFQFGLTEKIKKLIGEATPPTVATNDGTSNQMESMLLERLYRWNEWRLFGADESLYVWCDMCALEFSNGSNGWFRYMIDDKLYTMYSSGNPDTVTGSSHNRALFVNRMYKTLPAASASNSDEALPKAIELFDGGRRSKIMSGNWVIKAVGTDEIVIFKADGSAQRTTIRSDVGGFVFRSNDSVQYSVLAKEPLQPELFHTGWMQARKLPFNTGGVGTPKCKKQTAVADMAASVYHKYLERCCSDFQPYLNRLNAFVSDVTATVSSQMDNDAKATSPLPNLDQVTELVRQLKQLLSVDNVLSSNNLLNSGLVSSLFSLLSCVLNNRKLWPVFAECFLSTADGSDHCAFRTIVRKVVHVLECYEKLPLYLYDISSLTSGLSRKFKLILARSPSDRTLLDKTGKRLKVESLVTVASIKEHVLRMTLDRWYNNDRKTFEFVRHFTENHGKPLTFDIDDDEDDQVEEGDGEDNDDDEDSGGILAWVGTNGDSVRRWYNPAKYGLVRMMAGEQSFSLEKPENFFSRRYITAGPHSHDDRKSWICIDLGLYVVPSAYLLYHSRGSCKLPLGSWLFQMSNDGITWTTLHEHAEEKVATEPGGSVVVTLKVPKTGHAGWRYVMIKHAGK